MGAFIMKWTYTALVSVFVFAGIVESGQSAYIIGDRNQHRLVVADKQVVLSHGDTVWHGQRGGKLFAFIDGTRMYLTASDKGELQLTGNADNALNWDFSETKIDGRKKAYKEYYVPEATNAISTKMPGSTQRLVIVFNQDDVKASKKQPVTTVRPIRLVLVAESKSNKEAVSGSIFLIRGTDSRFVRNESSEKPQARQPSRNGTPAEYAPPR
jgi:hypothetical protein